LGNFRCNFWLRVGRLVAGLANRVSEASASVLNRKHARKVYLYCKKISFRHSTYTLQLANIQH
jgi:hypothetical protein